MAFLILSFLVCDSCSKNECEKTGAFCVRFWKTLSSVECVNSFFSSLFLSVCSVMCRNNKMIRLRYLVFFGSDFLCFEVLGFVLLLLLRVLLP